MFYSKVLDGTQTVDTAWTGCSSDTLTSYPTVIVCDSYNPFESIIEITNEQILAVSAAEKDRLYWSFKVLLVWIWVYIPLSLLLVLRLMISLSGWLAKVGKKVKSGN